MKQLHSMKITFAFILLMIAGSLSAQNVTVNPGAGSYPTLKAAFDAINLGTHTGAVTVDIVGNTLETATAQLNASGVGAASYTSVVITPQGGPRNIYGTVIGAIIRLAGADNVTIDGRIGGSGRNLAVKNFSNAGSTAAIWLSMGDGTATDSAGARNNTIRNLEISCNSRQDTAALSTFGIISSGTAISTSSQARNNDNNKFIANNIIRSRYGICVTGGGATNLNESNQITDNIIGPLVFGSDQIGKVGIFVQFQDSCLITRNEVRFVGGTFATTTGGADRVGIGVGSESWSSTPTNTTGKNYTVTRNSVHDVKEERTFSAVGIVVSTTTGTTDPSNNLIANNLVYNVAANGTAGDATIGIGHSGRRGDRILFNTVSLSGDLDPAGTTSASQSAAGLRISEAADTAVTVRNNVLRVEVTSNSGTLLHSCIQVPSATYGWGSGVCNNNNYYFPGSQMRLAALGTTSAPTVFVATLAAWKTTFTPAQDANSIDLDPLLVNPSSDVRPATGSPLVNAGAPIGDVTTDYLNVTRSVTTPTIGAYENTVSVNLPPSISYTTLGNTALTGNRALNTVAIVDADGIAGGSLAPRVYWRVNSGAWQSAATSSGSSPYDFTIGTLGLNVGDTVRYFVVAQDLLGSVGANPNAGFSATDVNNITTYPVAPNSYIITANALPVITYTILGNTQGTGNRALNNVTITDLEGIATGSLAPRVYWNVNNGAWQSAATTSGSSPYNFTIGTLGLNAGDTIRYFVVAQDILGAVAANPSAGFAATDVNNITTYPTTPNRYVIFNPVNFGNDSGYFYANSLATGQPSYPTWCWKDTTGSISLLVNGVSSPGSVLTGTLDDGYYKLRLKNILAAMNVDTNKVLKYRGTCWDSIFIGTNGIIGFTEQFGATSLSTFSIDGGLVADNSIQPLWKDNNLATIGTGAGTNRVSYKAIGDQLIITFDKVTAFSPTTDYVSYQVVLSLRDDCLAGNSNWRVTFADTTGNRTSASFIANYLAQFGASSPQATTFRNYVVGFAGTGAVSAFAGLVSSGNPFPASPQTTLAAFGQIFNTVDGRGLAIEFGPTNTGLNSHDCLLMEVLVSLEGLQLSSPTARARDTVTVYLRDGSAPPYNVLITQTVYLDSAAGGKGKAVIESSVLKENRPYYIVVKHRNSIRSWSTLINGPVSTYDFTSAQSQTFGGNSVLVNGKYSFYAGDVNQDGIVDITDISIIDNDVFNFVSGPYEITDVNWDGVTDITDLAITDNNASNFVGEVAPPGAARISADNTVIKYDYARPEETIITPDPYMNGIVKQETSAQK